MLVADWGRILRQAWSVRFAVLATLLGCVEVLLPFFSDAMPRGVFAGATVLASLAALVARIVAQPKMHAALEEPEVYTPGTCRDAPFGYFCTRDAGHGQPCALVPRSDA